MRATKYLKIKNRCIRLSGAAVTRQKIKSAKYSFKV